MRIYQHVDELNDRDGIGNDILGFHSLFQRLGYGSSIVTRINNSQDRLDVHLAKGSLRFFFDDIHILHYGGVGYPLELFTEIPGKKILRFHNLTPVSFFKDCLQDDLYKTFDRNEVKSHLELYSLHKYIRHVISDSLFNQTQYLARIRETNRVSFSVIPVIRHYPQLNNEKAMKCRIGFLGRWAPNKKLEDLLFTIFFLKKIDSNYKLVLLGKRNSVFQIYNTKLLNLIEELEISDSVEIHENLDDKDLKIKLSELDLFLSMSEHEGFGIPILEAMALGVPVLAYASSAIKETVKDAGILFREKNFPLLAELIHKILSSPALQISVRKSQFKMVKKYNDFPFEEKLSTILRS